MEPRRKFLPLRRGSVLAYRARRIRSVIAICYFVVGSNEHRLFLGRSLRLTFALLTCCVVSGCIESIPPPRSGTGTLWGSVKLVPRPGVKYSGKGAAYSDRSLRDAKFVDYNNSESAVVFIDKAGSPKGEVQLSLNKSRFGARFSAAVSLVGTGGTVVLKNADDRDHLFSCPPAKLLRRLPPGGTVRIKVPDSGELPVYVLDLRGLRALIFAVDGPAFLVGRSGRWVLPDLSPGTYTLRTWHPRLPPGSRQVQVKRDEIQRINLTIGVGSLSDSAATKKEAVTP